MQEAKPSSEKFHNLMFFRDDSLEDFAVSEQT